MVMVPFKIFQKNPNLNLIRRHGRDENVQMRYGGPQSEARMAGFDFGVPAAQRGHKRLFIYASVCPYPCVCNVA